LNRKSNNRIKASNKKRDNLLQLEQKDIVLNNYENDQQEQLKTIIESFESSDEDINDCLIDES
jgi:hypothetical protein